MWLYERKLVIVCNHLPGLVGVGIVAVKLIFFSSYRMTLRDHLFKGLYDLMGESFF